MGAEPDLWSVMPVKQRPKQQRVPIQQCPPPAAYTGEDVRARCWREVPLILTELIGWPNARSRTMLGKLLKDAHDDCFLVLEATNAAREVRPAGHPFAWIRAAIIQRATARSRLDEIAEEWGLPGISDLDESARRGGYG